MPPTTIYLPAAFVSAIERLYLPFASNGRLAEIKATAGESLMEGKTGPVSSRVLCLEGGRSDILVTRLWEGTARLWEGTASGGGRIDTPSARFLLPWGVLGWEPVLPPTCCNSPKQPLNFPIGKNCLLDTAGRKQNQLVAI